ncbi:MAG: hypothetical protein CVV05_00620 [Gammaproteobacteria bacterium HGW-Gammaproteobacteria-1]|jgi:hypothetical protein|nr:MAG: hypothetical protein CVV05_00620 [Gammaproteobacteria bacterium HGW-Gammaproteobacteria-1]
MSSNRHRPSFAIPVTPGWQPLIDHLEGMENHHVRSEWLRNAAWMRMLMEQGLLAPGGQDAGIVALAKASPAEPLQPAAKSAPLAEAPQPRPMHITPVVSDRGGTTPRPSAVPKPAMPPMEAEEGGGTDVVGLDQEGLRALRRLGGVNK